MERRFASSRRLKNLDSKAMEFESKTPKMEKVVVGSSDATINVRVRKPGRRQGAALHTLISYTDQQTAMQLAVYLAVLAVTFVLMRLYAPERIATPARS